MIVFTGVGAVISMPRMIGMLMGTNAHIRIGHGRTSPVSVCTDELTMVYAFLISDIFWVVSIKGWPES